MIVLSVVLWDCCKKWTIVEIEILATVSWTCGCEPFSCWCSQYVMHAERRCVGHVCSRNPCLLSNLSLHSLPEAWASWEPRLFRDLCIKWWLHHAHPFVAAAEKDCVMQRSRGFGRGIVVPRIVTIQWLRCQLCYVTAANQRRIVETEFLATVSWTCVFRCFSCGCLQNDMHCTKMCWTCLFKESICFL